MPGDASEESKASKAAKVGGYIVGAILVIGWFYSFIHPTLFGDKYPFDWPNDLAAGVAGAMIVAARLQRP